MWIPPPLRPATPTPRCSISPELRKIGIDACERLKQHLDRESHGCYHSGFQFKYIVVPRTSKGKKAASASTATPSTSESSGKGNATASASTATPSASSGKAGQVPPPPPPFPSLRATNTHSAACTTVNACSCRARRATPPPWPWPCPGFEPRPRAHVFCPPFWCCKAKRPLEFPDLGTTPSKPAKKVKKVAPAAPTPIAELSDFTHPAAAKVQAWIDALGDVIGDVKQLQRGKWQLRCTHGSSGRLRVLLVSGATNLFALNRTIAEVQWLRHHHDSSFGTASHVSLALHHPARAGRCPTWCPWPSDADWGLRCDVVTNSGLQAFGWGVGLFEHDANKGTAPPLSGFLINPPGVKDGQALVSAKRRANAIGGTKGMAFLSEKAVKVCHVLRSRGDELTFKCGADTVGITLDGIDPEKGGRDPLPRCVGADASLGNQAMGLAGNWGWKRLNDSYRGDRKSESLIFCTSTTPNELAAIWMNHFRRPLFDNTGAKFDIGWNAPLPTMLEAVASPFVK